MPGIHQKRVLPYTCEQMFDLVADVGRYPEFLPWCIAARIHRRDEAVIEDEAEDRFRDTGLRWRDAPTDYGPHKTLYNRFVRWSRMGVFNRIFSSLAGEGGPPERLMIDATHLKAHRPAASLLKKGMFPAVSDARKAA